MGTQIFNYPVKRKAGPMIASTATYPQSLGLLDVQESPSPLVQHRDGVGSMVIPQDRNSKVASEGTLVQKLRNGEEEAFGELIDRYQARLLRVARTFVSSEAMAEEVVQDTWMAVMEGIPRFEGRSSVGTWIFKILMNRAKTKGQRESRYVPFPSMKKTMDDDSETLSEPEGFLETGSEAGNWATAPARWEERTPERLVENKEALSLIEQTIESLSPNQRQVITLRDIEGLESDEVCALMNISPSNQRVLLHRARATVRKRINQYL